MLARIEDVPGVASAAIDRSGTLVRLRLAGGEATWGVDTVRALLRESGHETAVVDEAERVEILARVTRWFDHVHVSDLSREEASTLAEELASAVAGEARLDEALRDRLRETLRTRLEERFAERRASPTASLEEQLTPFLRGLREQTSSFLPPAAQVALETIVRARLVR